MYLANGKARLVKWPEFTADTFLHFLQRMQRVVQDEIANEGEEATKAAQRTQAEGLLNALGHFKMSQLVKAGVLRPGDFVVEEEDVAATTATAASGGTDSSGSDAAEQASLAMAQAMEEEERRLMREKQEREYKEALEADQQRARERKQAEELAMEEQRKREVEE
eukprot:g1757.t1